MTQELSPQACEHIMRRVRRIHNLQNFYSVARPFALDIAIIAAMVGCSAFFVSLTNFVKNMSATISLNSIPAISGFVFSAFINTELHVKLFFIVALCATILLLAHTLKGIGNIGKRLIRIAI